MNDLHIRTMRPDEIPIAIEWAANEGWNPGLADAACFATVDPDGFVVGEIDGEPAAIVSCVNYDARFAFLGLYIVRGDMRGRGHGLRVWNAAIAHAGARVIGLDGVVAQQPNYKRSGFEYAYANVRYGGTVAAPPAPAGRRRARRHSVGERGGRRRHGVSGAAHRLPARLDRRARTCRSRAGARRPARRLGRDPSVPHGPQDRPAGRRRPRRRRNRAVGTAGEHGRRRGLPRRSGRQSATPSRWRADLGLAPVFETARMYTGAIPPLRLERVFGITTFELG